MVVKNSNYTGNALKSTGTVMGGAICNLGDLDIDNCIFLENLKNYQGIGSVFGGAICSDDNSSLKINNSVFDSTCIGAEYKDDSSKLTVRNIYGGVLLLSKSDATIENTNFVNNTGRWG